MQDVKTGRNGYIGGSDIPVIMGISPFKTRYELLQEKAGIIENTFEGNAYTEYGNIMEGYIRDYMADKLETIFFEGKHVSDYFNVMPCVCHTDGENDNTILEIKTTSKIYDSVDDYMIYLVQLLFYMWIADKKQGILAVYERPADFDTTFDESRLQIFHINFIDYAYLLSNIFDKIRSFIDDLQKLKEAPLMSELDLMPSDIVSLTNDIMAFEAKLLEMKDIEKKVKEDKIKLKKLMEEQGIKKFETPNGYKVTLVEDTPDTTETVESFNSAAFKESHPKLYKQFTEISEKVKKGRSGYVKITVPKEDK